MKTAAVVVASTVLLLIAGCRQGGSPITATRMGSIGSAGVLTELVDDENTSQQVPLVHVLFVPEIVPQPGEGHGSGMGGGGTGEERKYKFHFYTFDRSGRQVQLEAHPVRLRKLATLEADGQTFALARGSVFVVHVARDGSLRTIQLPHAARTVGPDAQDLLAFVKNQLPSDARLQQVQEKS